MAKTKANEGKGVVLVSPNCADLVPQQPPLIVTKRFPDGESYCRLEGAENIPGRNVVIAHRLYPNPDGNIITLLQIMQVAKESGAKQIRLIIPYLPYGRADKQWLAGEAVSAKLIVRLLKERGAAEILTWNCHFLKKQGASEYEGIKIISMNAGDKLVEYLKGKKPGAVVISPDVGAKYIAGESGLCMKKERGAYANDEKAYRPIAKMEADFEVKGKDVILVDDLIAGGGTMVKATQKCLGMGAASVSCAATHGMFLDGALARLESAGAMKVVATDSIPNAAAEVSLKGDIARILKES